MLVPLCACAEHYGLLNAFQRQKGISPKASLVVADTTTIVIIVAAVTTTSATDAHANSATSTTTAVAQVKKFSRYSSLPREKG